MPVDVSDEAAVDNLFDTAADTYGAVDIAFNNAGISPPDDDVIEDTTELPAWQKVQDINLEVGVFVLPGGAASHGACEEGFDHVGANTASFVAVMGSATSRIFYTASKGGVLAMSRELEPPVHAAELRVNALCPGPGQHAAVAGAVRQGSSSVPRGGWCTCRWAGSPSRRNWPPRWRSWPATTPSFIAGETFLVDGGISGHYVTPL